MSITEIAMKVLVWVGVLFVITTISFAIVNIFFKIVDFFEKENK
jgi:hypothetical protein